MEKEAKFYKKLGENVQCELCPNFCFLKNNEIGKCRARKNIHGKLITLVYNKPCSIAIDSIEKKPLYHFLPGEKALSVATVGCNFKCKHCQNWQISQYGWDNKILEILPEDIIKEAKKNKLKIIAYTYTEPTIFYEYMEAIAKLAKKNKLKNVMITNGFINPLPLKELFNYIDAFNVDLKAFSGDFYKNICQGDLNSVLNTLKLIKDSGKELELTYLIIPGFNDSSEEINKMCFWIKENLGRNIPLHFSAFFPNYQMDNLPATSREILIKARNMARAKGLNYVYIGNISETNDTRCPNCNALLIERGLFSIKQNNLKNGKCGNCKEKIYGVLN